VKLREIVERLSLKVITGHDSLEVDVTHGYCSDLMSDVIANAQEDELWVTLQVHQNIIAVAVLKSMAGIVLTKERLPEEATIAKAEAEGLPVMTSSLSAFQLVGELFQLGISGR